MRVTLDVFDGPEAGRVFSFDQADSFLIGRSQKAHLRLDASADQYISRAHCLIEIRPPNCIVFDLESTNGTYVNGRRVDRQELSDGDEVRVGRTRIRTLFEGRPSDERCDFATQYDQAGEAAREDAWRDAVGRDDEETQSLLQVDSPEVQRQINGLNLRCEICDRDLTSQGCSDGRATEFPEATYLCIRCAEQQRRSSLQWSSLGRFRLLEEVGRGGMGVVYRAVHQTTRRVVAVKRILSRVARDERSLKLFDREVGVQSMVVHPNLVKVLERGLDGRTCYFALEYLAGGDLGRLMKKARRRPLKTNLAVGIVLQLSDGVAALHESGFVHRDLKPANFLLGEAVGGKIPTAKVSDYGLAKSFEEAGNSMFDYTLHGEAAGSFLFMPPEQIVNFRYVGPPSDVYALGVSLYFMLTTRYSLPFSGYGKPAAGGAQRAHTPNPIEVILEKDPVPIQRRRPDLPTSIARVVDQSVCKDPLRRYGTAGIFAAALRNAAKSEGMISE